MAKCEFGGCNGKPGGSRLCHSHYCQLRYKGVLSPIKKRRARGSPPVITYDEVPCEKPGLTGPCHRWDGYKIGYGYGRVSVGGKLTLVHRYVWERSNGPIPDDLEVDHVCSNKSCCNVDHLRLVTHAVNCRENVVRKRVPRSACKNGHEYTPENTKVTPGGRLCRTCWRANKNRFYHRHK